MIVIVKDNITIETLFDMFWNNVIWIHLTSDFEYQVNPSGIHSKQYICLCFSLLSLFLGWCHLIVTMNLGMILSSLSRWLSSPYLFDTNLYHTLVHDCVLITSFLSFNIASTLFSFSYYIVIFNSTSYCFI